MCDVENIVEKTAENNDIKPNAISRFKKREQAFILSFETLFSDTEIDELADNAVDGSDEYMSDYAIFCAKGILEHSEEIDDLISANLKKGWKISRISKVSYAIMRLAVFEMLYVDEVPVSVSINEAVELAKKYSSLDESAFVNGVLGAIAKSIDE
jgi:N utilization substance protein B